jgi:hypothetical protein
VDPATLPAWERADLSDPLERQTLATRIADHPAVGGECSMFHDLVWLLEGEGRSVRDVPVYVVREGGKVVAYAPFVVQPWPMRFRMGEVTLFSRSFERFHLNGGPLFWVESSDERRGELVAKLFVSLRSSLTSQQLIYLEGVVEGGEVERAMAAESVRRAFKVMEPSPRYERQLVRFPASFDEYLRSLKSQTRQNLRNSRRRLDKHLSGRLNLACYSSPDQMPEFVRRAVAISKTTYQWRLLGLGLRDPERLEQTLSSMARHGWTRCYLLECNGAATAFMIGYLYSGTYYYVDVGFDPDWEKWSVGTVLHMEVLRALMDGDVRARSFDFSSGTGVHKKRFGNESRREANFLLVPRSARNIVLVGAMRAMNATSRVSAHLLERLQLKAAIKRMLRRRATDTSTDD